MAAFPQLDQPRPTRENGRPGPPRTAVAITRDMTIKRLDHVSVVVDDLAAAIAFFTALGMAHEARRGWADLPRAVSRFGRPLCTSIDRIARVLAHIGSHGANRDQLLCQNCVRYPPKPRSNTVIYGDTPIHIVVAGSR
jgi:hypothetical protein